MLWFRCFNYLLYRLTDDVYQTAKVAKVLLLLNAGKGAELKGKHLEDIDVNDEEVFCDDIKQSSSLKPQISTDLIQFTRNNVLSNELSATRENDFLNEDQLNNNSSEPVIESVPPKKKNTNGRIKWHSTQKKNVLKYFQKHIKNKTVPKKEECLNFIKEHPEFKDCDWVRVKTLVYNTYRIK